MTMMALAFSAAVLAGCATLTTPTLPTETEPPPRSEVYWPKNGLEPTLPYQRALMSTFPEVDTDPTNDIPDGDCIPRADENGDPDLESVKRCFVYYRLRELEAHAYGAKPEPD